MKSRYGITNKIDAQKKINDIKQERKQLRGVLDEFQKTFVKQNNRKIRFTRDVAPVSTQFKLYKELK